MRAALDTGAFDTFHFPDGMIGAKLEENFGDEIDGSTGQHPGHRQPRRGDVHRNGRAARLTPRRRSRRKAMTRQR